VIRIDGKVLDEQGRAITGDDLEHVMDGLLVALSTRRAHRILGTVDWGGSLDSGEVSLNLHGHDQRAGK
jgi:hypothetical protein